MNYYETQIVKDYTLSDDTLEPYRDAFWKSDSDAVYPKDVEVSRDGSIFITGSCVDYKVQTSPSSTQISTSYRFFLCKFNESLKLQWVDYGGSIGNSLECYKNSVYTSSNDLSKYDTNGNRIWSDRLDGIGTDIAIGIDSDLYVVGYNESFESSYGLVSKPFLSRYTRSGIESWTKIWGDSDGYVKGYAVEASANGSIFVLTSDSLSQWNSTGRKLWEHQVSAFDNLNNADIEIGSEGELFVGRKCDNKYVISRYYQNGTIKWEYSISVNTVASSLSITDDNFLSAFVLNKQGISVFTPHLYTFDFNGSLIWYEPLQPKWAVDADMEFYDSGDFIIVGAKRIQLVANTYSYVTYLDLSLFNTSTMLNDVETSITTLDPMQASLYLGGFCFVVVVVVFMIYRRYNGRFN